MLRRFIHLSVSGAWVFPLVLIGTIGCKPKPTNDSFTQVFMSPATGFSQVQHVREFQFPADHGPHPMFQTEWWYLNSVVESHEGREFAVQFTLFRIGTKPVSVINNSWRSGQMYMGHVALSDITNERHDEFERLVRGHPALSGVVDDPFRAWVDGWELRSITDDFSPLRLQVETTKYHVDLVFETMKPIIFHGDRGLSHKSQGNASYYYSIPRMTVSGVIEVGTESHIVHGLGWLDREWSSGVISSEYSGWDWFALMLDDGRDLVVFRLRPREVGADVPGTAMWIDALGKTGTVRHDMWQLTPVRYWRKWPIEWRVSINDEIYNLNAAYKDQVMNTRIEYWEGLVYVDDGRTRIGKGFMELTGY